MIKDDNLRNSSLVLAILGTLDALYLSWVKLAHTQVFCGGSNHCQTVNNSPYSEIGGIPIAWLGLGAYLAILALLYLERRGAFWKENSTLMVFGISLAGTLYSAYLTFLEIAVIKAICPYCLVSAIILMLLLVVTILRMVQGPAETNLIRRGG